MPSDSAEQPAGKLYRLSAFTTSPEGGNPAGVWVGKALPSAQDMQRIAAEVGYSETIFITPETGFDRTARYFSPIAEVSFCGHATIAAGVLLGETHGDGRYHLQIAAGGVPLEVRRGKSGREASLTSVEPRHESPTKEFLGQALAALRWEFKDLDASVPPSKAYAGAWHLILAASKAERLAVLDYDFEILKGLMERENLTTVQLVWRSGPAEWQSRNPFPVGGVVEDPATGAAAAALGGYLRSIGLVKPPCRIAIRQGEAMGRPSRITVDIPAAGGIVVTGAAVRL